MPVQILFIGYYFIYLQHLEFICLSLLSRYYIFLINLYLMVYHVSLLGLFTGYYLFIYLFHYCYLNLIAHLMLVLILYIYIFIKEGIILMFIFFIQKNVIWIFLFWRIDSRQTGYQIQYKIQKIEISINLFIATLLFLSLIFLFIDNGQSSDWTLAL